ncbi:hypothetical protein Dred_2029 [Desulforamulus reducens MI-1]|uniref:Uncharacterized protein n=1 Tax=Desulforamulus reducens (strain ATCC BAA-1160 / DSM 100696 / MI-1) TaxID=349161 RepID=A4J643_DESRM|nr:hypothetical protein [Desulforamulus reducens]ABO50546.1 hypothetical protein Dred_2029 [Desulforamulus reducens MI-1]
MEDFNLFVKERLVALHNKLIDSVTQKHPFIFGILKGQLSVMNYRLGIHVTDKGVAVENYTLHLAGFSMVDVKNGVLAPEILHDKGSIKPYLVIEKDDFVKILKDQQIINHITNATLKFLD